MRRERAARERSCSLAPSGSEKIVFGSDYPLGWPGAYLAVLDGANPTDRERTQVLGGNLLRLIRRRRAA